MEKRRTRSDGWSGYLRFTKSTGYVDNPVDKPVGDDHKFHDFNNLYHIAQRLGEKISSVITICYAGYA